MTLTMPGQRRRITKRKKETITLQLAPNRKTRRRMAALERARKRKEAKAT